MQTISTDTADNTVRNLKYHDEGENIRLTFQWPAAVEQVYIFKAGGAFDIETASPDGARLYTVQEYKKRAGFTDRKTPGVHTYYVYPFIRENGEDIAIVQSDGQNAITCLTGQITVYVSISEKRSVLTGQKTHMIKLTADRSVSQDVLCYVKKEGGYPAHINDGVVYFFGEPLSPNTPLVRKVITGKNEYLRIFVYDTDAAPMYRVILS